MVDVTLSLTKNEALVLFDMLHRWADLDRTDLALLPGELSVIRNLSNLLERELVEPFQNNYLELTEAARADLFRQGGV